jgi:hypothetical protein
LFQSGGKSWEQLVSGSSLSDHGELRSVSGNVSAGHLDAIDIGVLVAERSRAGGSSEAAAGCRLSAALPTSDTLRSLSNRRTRDHCEEGDLKSYGEEEGCDEVAVELLWLEKFGMTIN